MGPTILFTHLKIILLQCFQFSVFSNNKFNPNIPKESEEKVLVFRKDKASDESTSLCQNFIRYLFFMKR